MEHEREQRFLNLDNAELRVETREEGEPRRLVGYAAVFDSDSEDMGFVERIAPGAFAEALKTSDVRALFNHDSDNLLGRTAAGTLELEEDDHGLRYEVVLPETTLARDLVAWVERGDITGNSFSFLVAEDSFDREENVRTIERIAELFDVGPVTFPAYPETVVSTRAQEMAREAARAAEADGRGLDFYERRARARGREL
jgi:HK97 family phage prohead protease